jgi:hypothetical protein
MAEPPAEVIAAAYDWCRHRNYDPGVKYNALFVPKDHEFNSPDEIRDLWHIFFYPETMKKFVTNFFVLVVDPTTLEVEAR